MLDDQKIKRFAAELRGELIGRDSTDYDRARALYNGMIDKRPLLIARCADTDDVVAAVSFGRDEGLTLAIRGGGHNGGGLGSCDDGLVIDLTRLKDIQVDPDTRTVRAQAGCTQGEIDRACQKFGLAVPAGIVSTTGIAGLTLGGGHGYLSRAYGLTIDNLLEADLVLADGRRVTANDRENPDLFWAIRGGGGNFGVVMSFTFRAHPVSMVFGGPIFWSIEHARDIMRFYREFLPQAPNELCTFLGLKTVPSAPPFPEAIWGQRVCALISCYPGSAEAAERALRPIRKALPPPLLDAMSEMPFVNLQSLFDPLLPPGLQWYWKGDFVRTLPDDAIDVHLAHASKSPTPLSLMHLYPIDGAVHRVGATDTPFSFRDATWSMVIAGIDPDPKRASSLVQWGRTYWEALRPYTLGAAYVNFMMPDESEKRVKATYGANYARLVQLKKLFDPHNLFHVNQNIRPTE